MPSAAGKQDSCFCEGVTHKYDHAGIEKMRFPNNRLDAVWFARNQPAMERARAPISA